MTTLVWPYTPQIDASEVLQWDTDVLKAYAGMQRISNRTHPRTRLTYRYHVPEGSMPALLRSYETAEQLIIPLWNDYELVTLASGATSFTSASVENKPYKVGQYVFIKESHSKYEACLVTAIAGDEVTFEATGNSYNNALIAPAVLVYPTESAMYQIPTSKEYAIAELTFQFEHEYLSEEHSYQSFEGIPRVPWRSLSGGNTYQINQNMALFDNVKGPLVGQKTLDYKQTFFPVTLEFDSRDAAREFKGVLNYFKGRLKSFWIPSWTSDFKVTRNIESTHTTIIVEKSNYHPETFSGVIFLIKTDNTKYALRVNSIENYSATEMQLNLSAAAGLTVTANNVSLLTVAKRATLNSDAVSITYRSSAIQFNLSCVTVPE